MHARLLALLLAGLSLPWLTTAAPYDDRFVWVFGWNLSRDTDVTEVTNLLSTAARHGCNGAVVSFGMDTLCKRPPEYFQRLGEVQKACQQLQLEMIPAVFSVGYGGGALAHDRNLAEGLPVVDAPFVVASNGVASLEQDPSVRLQNGGFEAFKENRFQGYNFHDQPGAVSFVDTQVCHSGTAALRLENFTANPHGHGRVMQEVRVRPRRCYRVTLWARAEGLQPANAFQISVLTSNRSLAPRSFTLSSSGQWEKLVFVFNSLMFDRVRIYAGVWGGKAGRLWLDDWSIEEVGPLNVLRRPGTPVQVRSADASVTYKEGVDYEPLTDPAYNPYRADRPSPALKIRRGGAIKEGQHLLVSWYHSMVIHESQVTVCMGEPALYEIFDHEARLLAERVRPRRVMLNMDEVRLGGSCQACRGHNMGALLGQCVTRQAEAIRRYSPGAQVYVWSDMFDPHHNARPDYYLVEGDFTGSWQHIPRDLTIAVWGGEPREKSLRFFAEGGWRTLVACYYDANDLEEVKGWLSAARPLSGVVGFMYTPWQKKYALLPAFAELLRQSR